MLDWIHHKIPGNEFLMILPCISPGKAEAEAALLGSYISVLLGFPRIV